MSYWRLKNYTYDWKYTTMPHSVWNIKCRGTNNKSSVKIC